MQFLTGLNAPSALEAATAHASSATQWSTNRDMLRQDARDALLFAQTKMAIYYDNKHKPISFNVGDQVYIRLAASLQPGYHLPHEVSHKLSQQRVGPFPVVEKVGRLAYKLRIPDTWKIHPVISVAHLEPYTPDAFDRLPTVIPDNLVGHDMSR